jgi:cellulose synthase/poly-beta-1,6-N-acetylglucosamine synthase-like glycosyltransferase
VTTSGSADAGITGPAFSFLTTAYRSEDTLPRTIESVLAQTDPDWELVLVDNGYADAIVEAASPYLDDPRIVLLRQENKGTTGGTMAAAARATGRYVVPLNSDDAVTPDFCERVAAVFATDSAIAAVTCDAYQFVDPGEQRLARTYLQSAGLREEADGRVPLRVADVIDGPSPYYTAAIRRDVFEAAGGFDSATPLVDDLDLFLRLLITGHDVRRIPDRLGRFRVEAGSVSRPDDPARIEAFEAQREAVLSRAAETSQDPEASAALDRVLGRLRYEQSLRRARLAFRAGDLAGARVHLDAARTTRRSLRLTAVRLGLRFAPGLLGAIHPTKRWLQAHLAQARAMGLRRWLVRDRRTRRPS